MPDYCIWNICNSNCIMCTNPIPFKDPKDAKLYAAEKVLERINSSKRKILKTKEDVIFTGGEPTIHPDFLYILKKVREEFPESTIAFSSNGRRFFYEDFVKKMLEIDNLRIQVVLHSTRAEIHDAVTRSPGSFFQTIKGLENIFKNRKKSHIIEIRIVLLKQNYKEIDEIYEMIYRKFTSVERVVTIFPEYEGSAEKNFESIKISFPDVKPYLEKAVNKWKEKFLSFQLYHFPLCVIDFKYWEHLARSLPPDHYEIFFMEKCEKCFYKDSCLGVYKDYVSYFGENHFKAIEKEIEGIQKNKKNYHHPIKKYEN